MYMKFVSQSIILSDVSNPRWVSYGIVKLSDYIYETYPRSMASEFQ